MKDAKADVWLTLPGINQFSDGKTLVQRHSIVSAATRHEAAEAGDRRQYRVWQSATDAARRLMGKDKSRINPQGPAVPADFADTSRY